MSKGIEIYARGATTDSTENVVYYIEEVMSVRMWELKDNFTGNRPIMRSDTNESKLCIKRRCLDRERCWPGVGPSVPRQMNKPEERPRQHREYCYMWG